MESSTTVLNLEQARKRAGVALETIAESTKISSRFLRAIESEEFEKLPGGVFDVSYIRQYAAAIRYADADILAVYTSRMQAAEAPLDAPAPPVRRGWSLRACFAWLLNASPAQRC